MYYVYSEHESVCPFRIVECPNSSTCLNLKAKDLNDHLNTCKRAKCQNFKYSCDFVGTSLECNAHMKECKYNHLKDTILEKEKFHDDILKISNLLTETNTKLSDIIAKNKNNEEILIERLGNS